MCSCRPEEHGTERPPIFWGAGGRSIHDQIESDWPVVSPQKLRCFKLSSSLTEFQVHTTTPKRRPLLIWKFSQQFFLLGSGFSPDLQFPLTPAFNPLTF